MKLLDLLDKDLHKSPDARIFLTGRPHIRGGADKHLARRSATGYITPTRSDTTVFPRAKLEENRMLGAMEEGLAEKSIQNIPETVSEM